MNARAATPATEPTPPKKHRTYNDVTIDRMVKRRTLLVEKRDAAMAKASELHRHEILQLTTALKALGWTEASEP